MLRGAAIGLMITASHNPEPDNGVKLVDPKGEMLQQSWEKHATKLANASDNELDSVLLEIAEGESISWKIPALVVVGQDTRPSSMGLAQAALIGIKALGGEAKDYGVVTTPMLHYFVMCINTAGDYGEATEEGYFKKLCCAFVKLRGDKPDNGHYVPNIIFDGANGVGATKMKIGMVHLKNSLQVQLHNDGNGKLNDLLTTRSAVIIEESERCVGEACGADYVKLYQRAPSGIPHVPNARCVSVDGDADRIIYFYIDANDKFHMLDGDRMATLYNAPYNCIDKAPSPYVLKGDMIEWLQKKGVEFNETIIFAGYLMELVQKSKLDLQLGLVQTAYANGSSTSYISETLKVPVACVPTGVKHLHHKALEYDIGVYFEANGHGTVIFSDAATKRIGTAAADSSLHADQKLAVERLKALMDVINQTVGDAISDMLIVETILHARGWSIQDWEATYVDLPNRQLKVVVKDRKVIQTTDAERQCVTPSGLQDKMNTLVKNFLNGRSFVRPSGTEDIVRVYAEADTQQNADRLAAQVASVVHQLAGGVGSPQLFQSDLNE
ncbi:hypothetical protein ANN_20087 [Periplaneta americana]|uniref:Phosphoacetylglucosamine mutase n=1 Tax=Periplaneta americana TaxID=6978 RepID=A0ABQ8SBM7_PERAM|nr:hypothetical protein ANN_20087 [Periplaneta americana]